MEPEINKIKDAVKEEVTREVTDKVTDKVTREVMREGITNAVLALKNCGQTDAAIKKAITKAYNISPKEAEGYL